MGGELRSVVSCYGLECFPLIWQQHPPCYLCQRHSLLTLPEPLHDAAVAASFHKREYRILALVHNEVLDSLLSPLRWIFAYYPFVAPHKCSTFVPRLSVGTLQCKFT